MKSGGAESIYCEIWGGRGPPGPPGSSAYENVISTSIVLWFSAYVQNGEFHDNNYGRRDKFFELYHA